mmetsp:Transcript_113117/g.314897  ORF Transcript_113117/g.314897 Transcript_113117/m.314897 type:complete len:320 (-) Transcript_113117:1023-1982(-)
MQAPLEGSVRFRPRPQGPGDLGGLDRPAVAALLRALEEAHDLHEPEVLPQEALLAVQRHGADEAYILLGIHGIAHGEPVHEPGPNPEEHQRPLRPGEAVEYDAGPPVEWVAEEGDKKRSDADGLPEGQEPEQTPVGLAGQDHLLLLRCALGWLPDALLGCHLNAHEARGAKADVVTRIVCPRRDLSLEVLEARAREEPQDLAWVLWDDGRQGMDVLLQARCQGACTGQQQPGDRTLQELDRAGQEEARVHQRHQDQQRQRPGHDVQLHERNHSVAEEASEVTLEAEEGGVRRDFHPTAEHRAGRPLQVVVLVWEEKLVP